jgi:hypothetical protein
MIFLNSNNCLVSFWISISSLPKKDERVLVIGTGEFMNVSYLLAGFLKSYSSAVFVQSTTRSPIMLGNDVHSLLELKENVERDQEHCAINWNMNLRVLLKNSHDYFTLFTQFLSTYGRVGRIFKKGVSTT